MAVSMRTACKGTTMALAQRSELKFPMDEFILVTKAVGDKLRAAILRALREESFGVLELCHIFEAAQPALSHHLKVLHRAGLVAKRREGNSIFYRRTVSAQGLELREALFAALDNVELPSDVIARIKQVHGRRRQTSEQFFANHVDALKSQQTMISPLAAYAPTVMDAWRSAGLERNAVLEVGPGDGQLLAQLASDFDQVVGIDSAPAMLARARKNLAGLTNVTLMQREFTALPRVRKYNLVIAAMVVHHMPSPSQFFQQASRIMKPGGLLVVAELCHHHHEWVRFACGDQWLGFEAQELNGWAEQAGFASPQSQFLAQKNGFRLQIHSYPKDSK